MRKQVDSGSPLAAATSARRMPLRPREATTRSIRLHGVVTSVRLENLFWDTLDEIGTRDGMNVPQLLSKLYDELLEHRGDIPNFTSYIFSNFWIT